MALAWAAVAISLLLLYDHAMKADKAQLCAGEASTASMCASEG